MNALATASDHVDNRCVPGAAALLLPSLESCGLEAFPMDPEALAAEIDIPLAEWPGSCHAIACAVRDHAPIEGMRIARGVWRGYVSRSSVYRGGPTQHSWLVLADGRILDPTRWAISSPTRPSIYCGPSDCYDEGGRVGAARAQAAFRGSLSSLSATKPSFTEQVSRLTDEELCFLLHEGRGDSRRPEGRSALICAVAGRIQEMLQLDPSHLQGAERVYRLAEKAKLKALIPIDNWDLVCEPDKVFVKAGANRLFAAPPREEISNPRKLLNILLQFLLIERRDRLEDELEELNFSLNDWHDALDELEGCIASFPDQPYRFIRGQHQFTLSVVISDLLGRGFGAVLDIERFAASLGLSRNDLDVEMRALGSASGFDLPWL
jgi:hypothetical protein